MTNRNYMSMIVEGQDVYIKRTRLAQLKQISGVVFDCDGVLIEITDSYNRTISKLVGYLFESLLGTTVPGYLTSDEVLYLIRRSGGFNNDWDSVYCISMFVLSNLPRSIRQDLKQRLDFIVWKDNPSERLSSLRRTNDSHFDNFFEGFFQSLVKDLRAFTKNLDATGVESVDRNLLKELKKSEHFSVFYKTIKRFLQHPGIVGESIIATAFEEFFCGSRLFQDTYGINPVFNDGLGMIENEKVIIQPRTIESLVALIGKVNLGIASGSRIKPVKHVLGDILERFNPEASVFLDTVESFETKSVGNDGFLVNLKKPNPFSLLKAASAFDAFKFVLYVGDSMEDAMMVKEAAKIDERFLFTGVYQYSGYDKGVLKGFLESGCDMVIPSVNELPIILKALRKR